MFAGIRNYCGVFFFGISGDKSLEANHRNDRYGMIPGAIMFSVIVQIIIPWIPLLVHENYGWKGIATVTFWLAMLSYAVLLNKAIAKYQAEVRGLIAKVECMKANSPTTE